MELVQIPWERLSQELALRLADTKQTIGEISAASGVDYFAVRRMKDGKLRRRTRNAMRLCTYFRINANIQLMPGNYETIVRELKATWDGSEAHAQLLMELIRSTRNFKVSQAGSGRIPSVRRGLAGGKRK